MNSPIQKLHALGQSIWYDNIQRRLLEKSPDGKRGELTNMIERGDIRGITSNPSIFHNAIAKTNDYDPALIPMAWSGWDGEQIFWQLAIEDIREACDQFLPLYHETESMDGYVSLEVNPALAHDTAGTLGQAKQLWERVARPNLMVKIPATLEGLPAIRDAISAGININVTLIFSIERYLAVMDAFLEGIDMRLAAGLPVNRIGSVASFFVSRMDTKVDGLLPEGSSLRGKTAIAYTKLAYEKFRTVFSGERFMRQQTAGCHYQRPLWASTSTKNPLYPDTLYVENLIGPDTVNTVPPQTLDAFRDHGIATCSLMEHVDEARGILSEVESLGISMEKVTRELEDEAVKSFADAFTAMLKTIDERRSSAASALGPLAEAVKQCVARLMADNAPGRLWAKDPSLWTIDKNDQEEIGKRLGWLTLPEHSRTDIDEIGGFVSRVIKDGFTNVILIGMGGSSLSPEVLSLAFPRKLNGGIEFSTLDSTDPAEVLAADRENPIDKTLYIISSKSGGTAEVNALFSYFWERTGHQGSQFVAITDPGTPLEELAKLHNFRKTYLANPTVGGRYSALTTFGLVPAGLMGVDLERLLNHASWMMRQCAADLPGARNPGLVLGAILGQAAREGRNKLTILADESVAPFGTWLEQLIAESSGKKGKGIVPIVGEQVTTPDQYNQDRLYVYLRREGKLDETVKGLQQSGLPMLVFTLANPYDLGSEFYRWEMAAAIACSVLEVNAFDQPDVQDAKDRTNTKIDAYRHNKHFDEGHPLWEKDGLQIFSTTPLKITDVHEALREFFNSARKGDYVAINAYLPRNEEMLAALEKLRKAIREKTDCATTVGFGPRFLHSTGQLHKGGPGSSLFLQITAEPVEDVEIPGQEMSFGKLERAQALGDYEALAARGRRILRLNLPSPSILPNLVNELK
jgi:transaldolase/glucose-6-phosphate isomerase